MEDRDWLVRPHYLQGPKWDGGNGLSKQELEHFHHLGCLHNDLTSDEVASLPRDCLDDGFATVKGVLGCVLGDDDKAPAHT